MIHLITRLPHSYHRTLCRTLDKAYDGKFTAWFMEASNQDFPSSSLVNDRFKHHFLSEVGYMKLLRALASDKEAVVILGGWSSPMTNRTLLIASLLRIPVFIWADHPHPRRRTWIKEHARKLYLRFLGGTVAGFLVCGRPTVEHLSGLGLDGSLVREFPYWVEIPDHCSLPPGSFVKEKPLRLIAVGRHAPIKQFEIAIRAIACVNRKAGRQAVELILVGDGPERTALESAAALLRCEESVQFCGWLEGTKLADIIESSDALVLPSKFDAYGVVVLEAMARGRPVLASRGVVAAVDRCDGSDAIMMHPAGDEDLLAEQIEMFADDRDRLRRAAFAARAIAEQWKPERAVPLLRELLNTTRRGTALLKNVRTEFATGPRPGEMTREGSFVASR
jgi:glycosyltransferase involved in cell wall biosynthesis